MHKRTRRWVFFGAAILVGIAAGVVYGWVLNPVDYTDTGPQTLRQDYQTDFVLMTAELYHADGDAVMALARLTYLSDQPNLTLLDTALAYAETHAYAPGDLKLMREMAQAIAPILPEVR